MNWDGLFVGTHSEVYEPSDDSFLLAQCAADEVRPAERFLEVGCGTGVVSLAAARAGATVVATDANPFAPSLAAANGRQNGLAIDGVRTDLTAGLRDEFDVVAFNPPYLPTDGDDKVSGPLNLAFDGGPSGNDVALRFASQIAGWRRPRCVLVVHSSLSDPTPLIDALEASGYQHEEMAREDHFFEKLWVRRFYR